MLLGANLYHTLLTSKDQGRGRAGLCEPLSVHASQLGILNGKTWVLSLELGVSDELPGTCGGCWSTTHCSS